MIAKIVEFIKTYHSEFVLGVVVACMCLISFNMGKMSIAKNPAHKALAIISPPSSAVSNQPVENTKTDLRVVASKAAGSKLYHFTWCSGAKRISEKNKLYFATEALAKTAGYTLAGNCNP